ncbi:MAG: hypothetical protein WCF20_04170 [Methylovirgula sp.]
MAEYYPLLAKAVAGLPNATPEIRRAIYERARKALLTQLNNLDPPLAESDVARETEALDGAVARLEAELTGLNGHAAEKPQAAPPVMPAPKAPARAAPPPVSPTSRTMTPPRRQAGPMSAQGVPSPVPVPPGPASPGSRSPGPTPPGPMPSSPLPPTAKLAARQNPAEFAEQDSRAHQETRPVRSEWPAQKTNAATAKAADTETQDGYGAESVETFDDESFADLQKPRVEGLRLYAPQRPADEARSSFRLWIVGGVVALVVVIVAALAIILRDRPDGLAKLKPPASAQAEKGGKIVERIGGGAEPDALSPNTAAAPASSKPASSVPASPAQASPAPKPSDANQTVPVAQRAALLVEAPDEPNKVKTYVGTVVWRLDNVSSGAGQPLGTAVHADIDIPGDKLKVALTLQKNTDPSLPVSHTMTIVFTVQPDSATGGIKQISVPQLRQDAVPNGESLIGVPVPIMENSFLIGLSRGAAEATNLDLIKQRAWFDIPILLGSSRIAKLTFEKGTSGTRAIDDSIAAWQAQ